jgi:hypothetical protein
MCAPTGRSAASAAVKYPQSSAPTTTPRSGTGERVNTRRSTRHDRGARESGRGRGCRRTSVLRVPCSGAARPDTAPEAASRGPKPASIRTACSPYNGARAEPRRRHAVGVQGGRVLGRPEEFGDCRLRGIRRRWPQRAVADRNFLDRQRREPIIAQCGVRDGIAIAVIDRQ